jgi:hypothetical protein
VRQSFVQLADGLAEFLDFAAEGFDISSSIRAAAVTASLFPAGFVSSSLLAPSLLAAGLVAPALLSAGRVGADVVAEAVGDAGEVFGLFLKTGFTQVADGPFHVSQLVLQFGRRAACGAPFPRTVIPLTISPRTIIPLAGGFDAGLESALAFLHRLAGTFLRLAPHGGGLVFSAGGVQFGGVFLHFLQVVFHFAPRFGQGLLGLSQFALGGLSAFVAGSVPFFLVSFFTGFLALFIVRPDKRGGER